MHPILFQLGPITIFTYGACVALGFVLGTWLTIRRADQCGIPSQRLVDIVVFSLLAGLIGARATYVLNHWRIFSAHPLEIVLIHHGGLVFYGGFLVALVFGAWQLKRASLSVWMA